MSLGAGCAGLAILGFALANFDQRLEWVAPSFFSIGLLPFTFRLDALNCTFLALLGVVLAAISLFSPSYLHHLTERINSKAYWCSFSVFVLSMALVLVSSDAITFLVFWELMSLSSLALVVAEHKLRLVQKASLIYAGSTRIATAFLATGFLLMYSMTGSASFSQWSFESQQTFPAALLIFIGLSIKAGIWPCHIWLPYAHPAAPAPVSALMSSIMIKVALYSLIRLLIGGNLACAPIGFAMIVLGAMSAFWGAAFTLVQTDLKRLLAYSTVEHAGLILLACGLSLIARIGGHLEIASMALTAALFHCINHACFKSLLFLGGGAIDALAHTRDIGRLGGLAKRTPWTFICFLAGSFALCSLPPLNGFLSKWLIYQSLLQLCSQSSTVIERALSLMLMGVLALVGGLAIAAFTSTVGVAFLGKARSKSAADATEGSAGMVVSQALLVILCCALGLSAPAILRFLEPACEIVLHHHSLQANSVMSFSPALLSVALIALFLAIHALVLNSSRISHYFSWDCGFGEGSARTQVTPGSFTNSLNLIFQPILLYKADVLIKGQDRRHFPGSIEVTPQVVSLLEKRVYAPTLKGVDRVSRLLAKLQAGSIHIYLSYLCLTLMVVLILGTCL